MTNQKPSARYNLERSRKAQVNKGGKKEWSIDFGTVTFYSDGSKKEKVIKQNLTKKDLEVIMALK